MSRNNTQVINNFLGKGRAALEESPPATECALAWAALAQAAATFDVSVKLDRCADELSEIGRYINQGRSW
jgi:hypothetical protein